MDEREITQLKKKLFSFGLFGTNIESFTEEELEILLTQLWTEIVTNEQIEILKSSFTLSSLLDHRRNYLTKQKHCLIRDFFKGMVIRMNTIEWKNFLCPEFKFVNYKFYFILDALVKSKEALEISELRKVFGIEPKMMFYMIKKLKNIGLVDKIGNDQIKFKNDSSQKKEFKENEQNFGKILLPINFPFEAWVKKQICESKNGISSNDLSFITGIPIKSCLKVLKKIQLSNKHKFRRVETFEGKIRRNKFYEKNNLINLQNQKKIRNEILIGEINNLKNNEILDSDRIEAIKDLVESKSIIPIDKTHLNLIKEKLGINYTFDRRTIVKLAKKIGYKVFKKKNDGNKYYISKHDFDENIKIKEEKHELTQFQKEIYKIFVKKPQSTRKNGFEPTKEKRIKLIYNFITEFMHKNDISSVNFDMNLIGNLNLEIYFKLFHVNTKFRKKVKKYFELKEDVKKRKEFYKVKNSSSNDSTINEESKKKIKVLSKYLFKDTLSIEDDEIRNLCINRYKIYKHKSIVDEIKEYNLFRVIEKDLIVLEPTNINFDIYSVEPNNIFLSNKENEKLFKNIKNIPENTFFDECFSFIILNYEKSKFDYLKTRLELFKRKNQNIYPENELSNETFKQQNHFLIKEIRKQVLSNEEVSLFNLIKKGFFFSKIITALKILSEEKFIAGFKSIYSLETIHLNDFLKKKLNINLLDYGLIVKNNVIDEYYSYFFNYIYFLFVTKGSHQKETLLIKCDFFTENELLDFFYIFSNIFRIEYCDNSYFVELIDQ